ncbi:MAG: type II toxin-antitoxin system RelE/ParE family toxin [Kiritimatiellae bacterium]|nr:type II toxin-antitoxin system RelE/ParE family toxin [Kiritimatiellia bacterium]
MYKIEWASRAFRQLRKIQSLSEQKKIYHEVGKLQKWPNCQHVKALQGRKGYRLRVGKWRVIFDIKRALYVIKIEEVKKRDEHTY